MNFTFYGLLFYVVVIQFVVCAPLNNGAISKSNDDQIPISDSLHLVNTLVEIYTFSHAKCEGMDFQGIIILTKVSKPCQRKNVCASYFCLINYTLQNQFINQT